MSSQQLPAETQLSTGPWKVESVEPGGFLSGENWLVASLGEDRDGVRWFITTDRVCASAATSEPESDAHAIVQWRNSQPGCVR